MRPDLTQPWPFRMMDGDLFTLGHESPIFKISYHLHVQLINSCCVELYDLFLFISFTVTHVKRGFAFETRSSGGYARVAVRDHSASTSVFFLFFLLSFALFFLSGLKIPCLFLVALSFILSLNSL